MGKVIEANKAKTGGNGENMEFQVERIRGLHTQRPTTTVEKEIASLADARVVENLFYLLEKYKRHTPQLHSMLVRLIYQIIKAERTNIVVFFELSYFLRGHRHSVKERYREMVSLLQHILRQFFKCAEVNKCAFVELLFRKIPDSSNEALLEDHKHEFAAILDDYEEVEYKKIMERMEAGETLNAMRAKQRATLASHGEAPWTEEEDAVLRERYAVYADHSLFAELLVAELPEDSDRTARQVRKRLADLGLLRRAARGQAPEQGAAPPAAPEDLDGEHDDALAADGPPAKKQKTMEERQTWPQQAEAETPPAAGAPCEAQAELDLERLLDAAMDEDPGDGAGAAGMDVEPGLEGSLEAELGAMLEDPPGAGQPEASPAAAASAAPVPAQDSLEAELQALLESQPTGPQGPPAGEPEVPPAAAAPEESDSLQAELEALLESQPPGPPAGEPEASARASDEAAGAAPAAAPPAPAACPAPGSAVEVQGLQKGVHLNGQRGTVIAWRPDTGRCRVEMADGSHKDIVPANLAPAGPAAPETSGADSARDAARGVQEQAPPAAAVAAAPT